jgi:hypothetical protein
MHNWRRIRRAGRFLLLILLIVISCGWLLLYLDSVRQRHKAERFVADLKSFPFATAGFFEVRELANRYGGAPVIQSPILQLPQYAITVLNPAGKVSILLTQGGPFTCTARECTFNIAIQPQVMELPLGYRAEQLLFTGLAYSGVQPWAVHARFEISGGKLKSSWASIAQLRTELVRSNSGIHKELIPFEYEIESADDPVTFPSTGGYRVGFPHVTGGPARILLARVPQTADAPTQRAFDVDLRCLTAVFRSCRGFDELAPSAWVDYKVQRENLRKQKHSK